MVNDKSNRGQADQDRIHLREKYELEYWTKKWNLTPSELKAAVRAVGTGVKDLARHLGKKA